MMDKPVKRGSDRHSAGIALAVWLFGRGRSKPSGEAKSRKRWKKLLADVAVWEKAGCPRDEAKQENG
jgi:hypothetical protein